MGAGMKAACAACEHVTGVAVVRTRTFVWQSHSSNPPEALLELYIVQGVWRGRTLYLPNPHAVFEDGFFF